ncbi:sodium-dependent transporter [candidate division WOR-3 bacterium]|nr:sodium-dependent transporter [candidate division WOR-3 bacterium]
MSREKGLWDSRTAFILAAIGSAIGLGNIWRFPYICYKYGGGSFLIAYIAALFIAGIPLLLLEFAMGYKMSGSAPFAFSKLKFIFKGKNDEEDVPEKKGDFQWVGWIALFIGFFITCYYAVIMGWSFNYIWHSAKMSWSGAGPEKFFYENVLHLTEGVFSLGRLQIPIIAGLVISWIWIVLSIWKGAKTVGKVVFVTVTLPWLLLLVFVVRGLFLPGAIGGIKFYLIPDFTMLLSFELWHAAFSQVFFSLSIGFGIMIAYASFLPPKSDIANNAIIIALADAATAFVGGFAVFSALGYYAQLKGVSVCDVMQSGPHLAFVTYPEIISKLPLAPFFGVLFFIMLLTLAIDSAFSLVEGIVAGLMDKFKTSRAKTNLGVASAAFIIGLLFTTGAGLYWLDITDHFMNNFGLFTVGFLQSLVVGYAVCPEDIRKYINSQSEIKIGKWWTIAVKYVIPIVSLVLLSFSIRSILFSNYGGYPGLAVFLGGWMPLLITAIGAYYLSTKKIPWKAILVTGLIVGVIWVLKSFDLFGALNRMIPEDIMAAVIFLFTSVILIGGIIYFLILAKKR